MILFKKILGHIAPGFQSVESWSQHYLKIVETRSIKPKTITNRRGALKHLVAGIGNLSLRSVRPAHIGLVVRRVWVDGKPSAARQVLIAANDLFNEALLAGLIDSNPARDIKPLPAPVRWSRLSLERWQAIHDEAERAAPLWFVHAMRLALVSGQRRSDIVRFSESWIWDDRLHIQQFKTGSKIALPMSLTLDVVGLNLGDVIADTVSNLNHGDTLLHKINGAPFGAQAVTARYAEIRDSLFPVDSWGDRTPAPLHEIRSLSERLYRAQGVDTKTLLGHKRQRMTDQYNDDRGLSDDWQELVL